MHPTTLVGIVVHRAVQLMHTHPGMLPGVCVDHALEAALSSERAVAAAWEAATVSEQSDMLTRAASMVASWTTSWPALDPAWLPRFEESVQARIGSLVLSGRIDLVLGRPRADLTQSMFLADIKSGGLSDHHNDEAAFYALVATLRNGVAPWRSCVFSLASGEWTDPTVDEDVLWAAAEGVVRAVKAVVAVRGGRREPETTPGHWCSWCPSAATCPAAHAPDVR